MRLHAAALGAVLTGALLFTPMEVALAQDSCLEADKTGMAWVHPFEQALEKAKTDVRLLMIKPVAFGTTPDGGW